MGDFIRIELNKIKAGEVINNIDIHVKLNQEELKIHKLAATALLTSQGPIMIAQGQEWGRSKVIADVAVEDENIGKIDHNSYEKDNETNWLNWEHKIINEELNSFYRKLITLRKEEPAFRRMDYKNIEFLSSIDNDLGLGYFLNSKEGNSFLVLLNSSKKSADFYLPDGKWRPHLTSSHLPRKRYFTERIEIDSQSMAILMIL